MSSNALLRLLLIYIPSYVKSVLRNIFLILNTYRLDTIYVSKNAKSHGYFSEVKGVSEQKCLGNTDLDCRPRVTFSCSTLLLKGTTSARAANFILPPSPPLTLSYYLYLLCRLNLISGSDRNGYEILSQLSFEIPFRKGTSGQYPWHGITGKQTVCCRYSSHDAG